VAELRQAKDLTLHEYHNANHDEFNWGNPLRESFIVDLFPREGEVHPKGVEHTRAQLGWDGCCPGQPLFHSLGGGWYFVCGKLLNKVDDRS
jgi:hypothetical protein